MPTPLPPTRVLSVVVLTVVICGGTSAQMLEVLGIQTGVEDDAGASSDEDEPMEDPGQNAWVGGGGTGGGSSGAGGRWYLLRSQSVNLNVSVKPITSGNNSSHTALIKRRTDHVRSLTLGPDVEG